MENLFLILNGVLYVALGIWCTLLPGKTSSAIGFSLPNNSAKSEYIVVYGGLEIALGGFFLLCAIRPGMTEAGLWFGLLLYGCLTVYRWGTIIAFKKLSAFIYTIVTIETAMALWAAWLVWSYRGT